MINPNFVLLGVLFQFIGGLSYVIDTVKGKIKPNKVTWILWSLAPLIAFIAEIKQGVGIQSLTTFVVGFIPLLVFIASFLNKKAQWKISKLDIICGILSILGLILWLVTKVGNVAIFFSILADGIAAIPTIVKAYHQPESDNDFWFLCVVINASIALLSTTIWDFQHYAFPIYLIVSSFIIFLLIRFKLGNKIKTLY